MFLSRIPKGVQLGQDNPSPGTYDPLPVEETSQVVRVPRKKEGFLTTTNRFEQTPRGTDLGPGQYNAVVAQSSFNRAMGRVDEPVAFTSCASRFDDDIPVRRPGPGHYNVQPTWVKKTHNCLFGDVP